MRRDPVGNLVARVGGSGPRVLVQAHMDQVGYVVRHVTDDGFLLLDGAQGDRRTGPERRHPVGQPVRVAHARRQLARRPDRRRPAGTC